MMILRNTQPTPIVEATLPDDALQRRYNYSQVVQKTSRSIGGSMFLFKGQKHAGETLEFYGTSKIGWITKGVADALQSMYNDVDAVMELDIDGVVQSVVFDYSGGDTPPLTVEPVRQECVNPSDDEPYSFTLKLLTVE